MKTCNTCESEHPLTQEFYSQSKVNKSGFRNKCKQCEREHSRKYYQENKAKVNKRNKEYQKNHVQDLQEYRKTYYKENHEKILFQKRKYLKANRDRYVMHKQLRRAKEKQLFNTLTAEQWKTIKQTFDNKCAYCGEKRKLTKDHFIPLSKNGEYSFQNIIPACLSCNSSKKDKDFSEWYLNQNFYDVYRENKIMRHLKYENNKQQLNIL
ncbi:HNH endonuclease [Metabacillus idriensis]|uniref:HNH endonuclease n=1 Tax=Metabacillus idriensis TaxID=324768 RepID=UPI001CD57B7C|nr:HNH endonuclease signature motif containing protein [Metabacillus idriensis]